VRQVSAWKDLERRVCRRWGGERTGPVGRDGPDCVGTPVAIQVKRTSRTTGGIMGSWVQQAKLDARRAGKPWVLVVGTPGSPHQVAACDHERLAALHDVAQAAEVLCKAVETGGGTFPFELAFRLRAALAALAA
jgi:hypothetical protein